MKTLIKIKNKQILKCFKQNNRITCILDSGEIVSAKDEISIAYCDCGKHYTVKSTTKLSELINNKKYFCNSCLTIGKRNPFYGKKHSDNFKNRLKSERKGKWYLGKDNGMFNKTNYDVWVEKYGKEIADKKQKESDRKNKESNSGIKNGFYGKKHSINSISIIKLKNEIYREKNKQKIIENGMIRLGLTDEILKNILNDYRDNPNNIVSIHEKYKLDFRTIQSYWLKRNILSKNELKTIKRRKKFLGNRDLSKLVSKPEYNLYEKLKEIYGDENVKSCFIIPNTVVVYDICLFNRVLVEYDGFYWHKIKTCKNDFYKTRLAKDNNYVLYRVEEDSKRHINLTNELNVIKCILLENKLL